MESPASEAYARVAAAIAEWEPVFICADKKQARERASAAWLEEGGRLVRLGCWNWMDSWRRGCSFGCLLAGQWARSELLS